MPFGTVAHAPRQGQGIAPATDLGQTLAAIVMIIGYRIIAVPTGIVTAELARESHISLSTQACPECGSEGHDANAVYCKYCGAKL
jgi:voltage-gated potassium channel